MFKPTNYLPAIVRQRVYNAFIINESIIKRNCLKKKTINSQVEFLVYLKHQGFKG